MTLVKRFDAFFAAVNDGAKPYPWQRELMTEVARTGRWPAAIGAPTGSGKSSVVDIHVFLVAERHRAREQRSPEVARPPRRLVLVAPRRVLVEDQYERALTLARRLIEPNDDVVKEVAAALDSLKSATGGDTVDSPLGVARLRGGVQLDHSWRLDPTRCQVICATPQMWGSRLLMRGFHGTRASRNLEAGLLGHDAAAIIDEAHLHERLVETARRIGSRRESPVALQVVAMSATRAEDGAHGLTAHDLDDKRLQRRVLAKKAIVLTEVDDWRRDSAAAITQRATAARSAAGGTVGVFVNTVATALEVASQLEGEVEVVCGRMRSADLAALRQRRDGLLDARGNDSVDFLVSTQSLEVGVDLDLPAVVTALAPASALAQRAGRLNRSGRHNDATLDIVAPRDLTGTDPKRLAREFVPYQPGDVVAAREWVERLAGDASPHRIASEPLPIGARPPLPPLSHVDLETLAMTSNVNSADPDVTLYVDEPRRNDERQVSIGARRHIAASPPFLGERGAETSQVRLSEQTRHDALLAAPPRAHELASLPIGPQLEAVLAASPGSWVLRTSAGVRSAEPIGSDYLDHALPGDVVLVPEDSRVLVRGTIGRLRARPADPIKDVMRSRPADDGEPDLIVMLDRSDVGQLLESDATLASRASRDVLAKLAGEQGDTEAAKRLKRLIRKVDVSWHDDVETPCGLLVIRSTAREGELPRTAVTDELIALDEHGSAVERRMHEILDRMEATLGVTREQLETAARLHDEGKRHPRFQRRIGAMPDDPPLAKPRPGWTADRGDGWRHEQLSCAYVLAITGDPLVAVLVAGHHGHGRFLFDREAQSLLNEWDDCDPAVLSAATELFGPAGRYERDRAAAQDVLGVHGLAHVEALLRCADMQVSREGH